MEKCGFFDEKNHTVNRTRYDDTMYIIEATDR